VLLATSKYGVAAISDSAAYVSAARNVAEGRGFTEWNGDPYVMWPPLYPALLAVFEFVGVDALVAARWINAALLAAVAVIAGFALRQLTGETTFPAVIALSIAVAPALLDTAIAAMSEPLFISLVLACLVVLARHLKYPTACTLLVAATLAALAWLTRYAGFALVATGCVLLLARRGRPFAASLSDATVFGAIASAPMIAWLTRNYLVARTTTGVRVESPYTFAYLAELAVQRIGQWFLPPRLGPVGTAVLGAAVIGVAVGVLVMVSVRPVRVGATRPRWWEASRERAAVVFAAFILIYVSSVTLVLSLSFATDDPKRLLAPALPPTLMLLGIASTVASRRRQRPWIVVGLSAALLVVWPSRYAVGAVTYARRNGAGGIASDRWRQSDTMNHLRERDSTRQWGEAVIYSNEPTAVYLLAGMRSVYWLPPHDYPYSPVPARVALETFARELPKREPTYIVLFEDALKVFTYPRALVEATLPLELIHSARDGVIYRVRFSGSDAGLVPRAGAMTPWVARIRHDDYD
jgi:hypothetical protein